MADRLQTLRNPFVIIVVALSMVAVSILSASSAMADDADHIVQVLSYQSYYDKVAALAIELSTERLKQSGKFNDQQLADARAVLTKTATEHRVVFLKNVAGTYREKFTAKELSELLRFYNSPLGRKVSAEQSAIQDALGRHTNEVGLFLGVTAASLAK